MAGGGIGNLSIIVSANALPFDREMARVQNDAAQLTNKLNSSGSAGFALPNLGKMFGSGTGMIGEAMAGLQALGPAGAAAGAVAGAGIAAGMMTAKVAADSLVATVTAVGDGLAWAATRAVKLAADFELAGGQFKVLTGSKAVGSQLLGEIEKLAIRTPYDTKTLSNVAISLLGKGVKPDNMIATLTRLGDLAMGDATKLGLIGKAYGDVLAKNRLMAQEMNQFTEAGVPAWEAFAKAAGMSVGEMAAAMEAGGPNAPRPQIMQRAINQMTSGGGSHFGMGDEMSRTVIGQWNAIAESTDSTLRVIGEAALRELNVAPILGRVAGAIQGVAGQVQVVQPYMRSLGELTREVLGRGAAAWDAVATAAKNNQAAVLAVLPSFGEVKSGLIAMTEAAAAFGSGAMLAFSAFSHAAAEYLIRPIGIVGVMMADLAATLMGSGVLKMAGAIDPVGGKVLEQQVAALQSLSAGIAATTVKAEELSRASSKMSKDLASGLTAAVKAGKGLDLSPGAAGGPAPAVDPIKEKLPDPPEVQFAAKWRAELVQSKPAIEQFRADVGLLSKAMAATGKDSLTAAQGTAVYARLFAEFAGSARKEMDGMSPAARWAEESRLLQGQMSADVAALRSKPSASTETEIRRTYERYGAAAREGFDKYASDSRAQLGPDANALQKYALESQLLRQRMAVDPTFTRDRFDLAMGRNVQDLQRVLDDGERKLAGAIPKGSQQAESIITRAMVAGRTSDPQREVADTLARVEKLLKDREDVLRKLGQAADRIQVATVRPK